MQEKIYKGKKNGMRVMVSVLLLYLAAIGGFIVSGISLDKKVTPGAVALMVVCALWALTGWIFFCGLKVIRPQEALVLTLFGNYKGSIKDEGFYWVNPFCEGINPGSLTA